MTDVKVGARVFTDIDRLEFTSADTDGKVHFMEAEILLGMFQSGDTAIIRDYYENRYVTKYGASGSFVTQHFKTVYLPNVTTSAAAGAKVSSENIIMPRLTVATNQLFYGYQTKVVDLTDLTSTTGMYSFGGRSLEHIIIRGNVVPQLANTAQQKSNVALYVPSSMMSAYQSDSNFSTLVSDKGWTINAIEGSEYEDVNWFKQ